MMYNINYRDTLLEGRREGREEGREIGITSFGKK